MAQNSINTRIQQFRTITTETEARIKVIDTVLGQTGCAMQHGQALHENRANTLLTHKEIQRFEGTAHQRAKIAHHILCQERRVLRKESMIAHGHMRKLRNLAKD